MLDKGGFSNHYRLLHSEKTKTFLTTRDSIRASKVYEKIIDNTEHREFTIELSNNTLVGLLVFTIATQNHDNSLLVIVFSLGNLFVY